MGHESGLWIANEENRTTRRRPSQGDFAMRKGVTRLLIATAAMALAAPAVAAPPVWESNTGTFVLGGDDVITSRALPFGFSAFGQTYNSLVLSTNGFVQFAGTEGAGCCNGNVADLLGGAGRIAPLWTDLVTSVYENNSVADRAVYTWQGIEYGRGGAYDVQLQLFQNGRFSFGYNGSGVPSGHNTLTGVSPGGGASDPGQSDFSTFVAPRAAGSTAYHQFSPNTFDLNGGNLFFTPKDGGYLVSTAGFVTAPTGALPEPATWAMMIGGFGMVGGSMRYRRAKTRIAYATA
jgi:hypothetical protein